MDETETKFCTDCSEFRPITEFRLRRRNASARMCQCNRCHNENERCRRANRNTDRESQSVRWHLERVRKAGTHENIERLVGEMLVDFGGVQGFAESWRSCLDIWSKKGATLRLKSYLTILHLMVYCEEKREQKQQADSDELKEMSDEELKQSMFRSIMEIIKKDPEIALAAAMELGWQVIPPTD